MIKICVKCEFGSEINSERKYIRSTGYSGGTHYFLDGRRLFHNNTCHLCIAKWRSESGRLKRKSARVARMESAKTFVEGLKRKECRDCKNTKSISFIKTMKSGYTSTHVYREDSTGRLWYGNRCPSCTDEYIRKHRGHTDRENSRKPSVEVAVRSEKIAEKRFIDLGFTVERNRRVSGADLVCKLGDLVYTVEVKRATYSGRSWRAHKVRPARISDDLIAIVMPNDYVYIDSMKNHLLFCTKYGSRPVTDLVKEFGLDKPLK